MSDTKVTTPKPEDFITLKKYTNPENRNGEYLVYIKSVSECCIDINQNLKATPIEIPQN